MPQKLSNDFNILKGNGGPMGAAALGAFCLQPADFA
jgi:hypothetical protein